MFSFFSDNFEQLGSFLTSHSEAEKLAALDKKKFVHRSRSKGTFLLYKQNLN